MERTFESSLTELERIVEQLESGEMSLDESLELFEKGIKLSRECRNRLNDAERRIEILMADDDGNLSTRPIEAADLR